MATPDPDRTKRYRTETERFLAEQLASTRPTAQRIREVLFQIAIVLVIGACVAAWLYFR